MMASRSKKDKDLNKLKGNTQANRCYTILRILLATSDKDYTTMYLGKVRKIFKPCFQKASLCPSKSWN